MASTCLNSIIWARVTHRCQTKINRSWVADSNLKTTMVAKWELGTEIIMTMTAKMAALEKENEGQRTMWRDVTSNAIIA